MKRRNDINLSSSLVVDDCLIPNDEPRGGLDERALYPDHNDASCWTLAGTWGTGALEVRGRNVYETRRRFETPSDAAAFYTRRLGQTPIERASWGFGAGCGGRWGLKFRGSRPEKVPFPTSPEDRGVPSPTTPNDQNVVAL